MRNKLLAIVGVIAMFAMAITQSAQGNLLTNAHFTVDDGVDPLNAAGWVEVNNGGWVNRETNPAWPDPLEIHYAIGNAGAIDNNIAQTISGAADESYLLEFEMMLDDWWTPTGFASIEFLDLNGDGISTNSMFISALGYDAAVGRPWTNYSLNAASPAGTVFVRVRVGGKTPGENGVPGNGGGTCRFDNLVLTSFSLTADADGDDLPDWWESSNGLDPNDATGDNGKLGDPDLDLLTNFDEFNAGTLPQVADTDGDGLTDGDELNVHSTDPLDPDADNDGLTDGEEVLTYFTDAFDPNSDGDAANDATEVYAGSDPNSAASLPANARPDVVGIESFYYNNGPLDEQTGGELFDYDNTTNPDTYTGHTGAASAWEAVWNTSWINAGQLETRDSGVIRSLNGVATGGEEIALFGNKLVSPQVDSEVLYAKIDMTVDPEVIWGGLSLFADGKENIFFGVGIDSSSNLWFKMEESGLDTNFTAIAVTTNTHTLVVTMDANAGSISMWVDPNLALPQPAADLVMSSINDTNAACSAIRIASGDASGAILWDNFVVGTTWDSLSETDSDSDSDGLPDAWEINYGLDPNDSTGDNGAGGNPDADGFVNSDELANGTDPTLADTDEDGLDDDVEVNTVSSDPLVWDTDGDGLNDGDEVNTHGTNPLLVDTDSDGEDDWFELFQGTDPTDIASTSASEGIAIVDGTLDAAYGAALAVQTVNIDPDTWEDNLDELDAAYAYVKNDRLYLMLTGNMNTNWNKLEIFIDSSDAVTTNVFTGAGNDNTANMAGLVFDEGFSPDYHINARIGRWDARPAGFSFNLDFADLGATNVSWQDDAFTDSIGGIRYMGTGDANTNELIAIGFDNSNVAGVIEGITAANPAAALAVTTGFECSIALADLGNPTGDIRIMAMVCSNEHATVSNQILPGIPPQAELGDSTNVNFSAIAGDQFFTVAVPLPAVAHIVSGQLISGNTEFQLNVSQLVPSAGYKVQETADLAAGFTDVPGSDWTAAATDEAVVVPADTGANPAMFYQVVAP